MDQVSKQKPNCPTRLTLYTKIGPLPTQLSEKEHQQQNCLFSCDNGLKNNIPKAVPGVDLMSSYALSTESLEAYDP